MSFFFIYNASIVEQTFTNIIKDISHQRYFFLFYCIQSLQLNSGHPCTARVRCSSKREEKKKLPCDPSLGRPVMSAIAPLHNAQNGEFLISSSRSPWTRKSLQQLWIATGSAWWGSQDRRVVQHILCHRLKHLTRVEAHSHCHGGSVFSCAGFFIALLAHITTICTL